jgi:carbamoyl-phosphate synthase large subunit
MLHGGYSAEKVHELTKIDKWFLHKCANMVDTHNEIKNIGSLTGLGKELLQRVKQQGFSDLQLSLLLNCSENDVRARRKKFDIHPWVKKIVWTD